MKKTLLLLSVLIPMLFVSCHQTQNEPTKTFLSDKYYETRNERCDVSFGDYIYIYYVSGTEPSIYSEYYSNEYSISYPFVKNKETSQNVFEIVLDGNALIPLMYENKDTLFIKKE